MEFKILSHSCLLITTKSAKVIVDPWLLGSCYWRSWWNFPEAQIDENELKNVSHVILSHIHWDHWHGITLKKFFKDCQFLISNTPGDRSYRDLKSIGCNRIKKISHGQNFVIGDLKVTFYLFGLNLIDTAMVIESDGVKIFNANDSKISGAPLKNILKRHKHFDFAFRSHASANPRVCFKNLQTNSKIYDDKEHYFRSFLYFMNFVKPTYAIPFASNMCHLHDDTYKYNTYITNPLGLRSYLNSKSIDWKVKVMLPGSSWSNRFGFKLAPEKPFSELELSLQKYKRKVGEKLYKYKKYENKIQINDRLLNLFRHQISRLNLKNLRDKKILISIKYPNKKVNSYIVNCTKKTLKKHASTLKPLNDIPIMILPPVIFRDSVLKKMFHSGGISKRIEFLANSENDLETLRIFFNELELYEHEVLEGRSFYRFKKVLSYVRRWREILVYFKAIWLHKIKKKPLFIVEEEILKDTA